MASRNAVIATKVGGIVDLIRDGVNGLLAAPKDPASLESAIQRLLDEPALAQTLAERGAAFVSEDYSINATADGILKLYRRLLAHSTEATKQPPKIVRVITRLNVGGPAVHTILLADGLRPEYETVLVSGLESSAEGNMLPLAERLDVRVVRIPHLRREIDLLADFLALARLIALILRERPDIVHTHTAKAGVLGRIAARICGIPVIIHTFHGNVFRGYFSPRKTRFLVGLEQLVSKFTDRVVAVNEEQRDELVGFKVASPNKIVTVPLGLELQKLVNNEADPAEMRRKWGVPLEVPTIGIVARLVHIKGHELFLEAASEVHKRFPDAWFVIVGDGERRAELEEQARELGVPAVFTGWETDLPAVYRALDVVCLTSINEGSPVAVIEALAAGKPVVSTLAGGVVDLIRTGDTGLLVPTRDPTQFANAVCRILSCPEEGRAMGARGRASVYPALDLSNLLVNLDSLYASCLKSKLHLRVARASSGSPLVNGLKIQQVQSQLK
jgi:glycosyltransferase involved in cell wall biosynthesis